MSQNTEIDPVYAEEIGHGNSIAAWSCVLIMTVGFIVGGIAFANLAWSIVWVGCGIVVLGLIVGAILKAAGFGVGGARSGASH
ncbi:HGxxPAAW family protein [Glutamicibacter sp. TV12E]|uniref:HGxxPAAW family protein n=1 Tax=Glutamicibacter sp. TV12E TaxID=3446362 RepID=UPI004034E982